MPYAVTARRPVSTVVLVFVHTQTAGQRKAFRHCPFIFGKQGPAPARQFVQAVSSFQLITLVAQFLITILPAEGQRMIAEENLVLVVEGGVIGAHFATGLLVSSCWI